ncbi:MAG TPA: glycosyltransferase, partial [Thermoanaerobaculia bacterium]|nr:glycosyltransferase [Thermoanaerobaculia bacterium]
MTGPAAPGLSLLFLSQTYPRFEEDTPGPFIRDLARGLARGGDRVTVLLPHTERLETGSRDGVEVISFRYAPAAWEILGYSRTLAADERVRGKAALVAPLYALAARRAVFRLLAERRFDLVHAHFLVPNGVALAPFGRRLLGRRVEMPPFGQPAEIPLLGRRSRTVFAIGLHGSDVFLAEKPGARQLA